MSVHNPSQLTKISPISASSSTQSTSYNLNSTSAPLNSAIIIDHNKCMARKNKGTGINEQCPYKKKVGDYCKIHAASTSVSRIDQTLSGDIKLIADNSATVPTNTSVSINISDVPAEIEQTPAPKKIMLKKTLNCINPLNHSKNNKKKLIKIIRKNEPYTRDEFLKLDQESINYGRLATTLRHHLINLQGDTMELFRLAREFFQTRWLDPESVTGRIDHISPYFEKISGEGLHDRSICDNTADFFDLIAVEDIPDVYYFSFKDSNGRVYGCDFRSFHKLVETSKYSTNNRDMNIPDKTNWTVENPYNRETVSDEYLQLYEEKKSILVQNHLAIDYPEPILDEETQLNLECLETFQVIYGYGYPVDHNWFAKLNKSSLVDFYNKLEDIWNYRLQLTNSQKKRIVPNNDIFDGYEKKHVGSHSDSSHPEATKKLKKLILNVVKKLVTEGVTKGDCINGAIYVLTALVEVSPEAADAMPGFVYIAGDGEE